MNSLVVVDLKSDPLSDPLNDPLNERLELLSHFIHTYALDESFVLATTKDVSLLNTFALANHWENVDLLIKNWTENKTRDPAFGQLNAFKYKISIDVAVECMDIELLSRLVKICGKYKLFKLNLSCIALALEKTLDPMIDILFKGFLAQRSFDLDSVLGGLPESESRARQIVFNRYCVVANQELIQELFIKSGIPLPDIPESDLVELMNDHRIAMISYLSRGSETITLSEDVIWNTMKSGNTQLAKLLQSLKIDSAFAWMETNLGENLGENTYKKTFDEQDQGNGHERHASTDSVESNLQDTEYYQTLALYAAYGGKLSGIDRNTRKELKRVQEAASTPPSSPRMFSKALAIKSLDRSSLTRNNSFDSTVARSIVNSSDDSTWKKYLNNELTELPYLSWMEPDTGVIRMNYLVNEPFSYTSITSNADMTEEDKVILEGYGGFIVT